MLILRENAANEYTINKSGYTPPFPLKKSVFVPNTGFCLKGFCVLSGGPCSSHEGGGTHESTVQILC